MIDATKVKHYGIYRGIVLDNNDPGITVNKAKYKPSGRCKIFFEGIYSEKFREEQGKYLPWAEPVYPIFGGNTSTAVQKDLDEKSETSVIKNYTNPVVGWGSVPHIGAYVWGFFEDGNIQYPKFFGVTQMGPCYLPEHKNQHVIATDNVKIIIDEEPENVNNTKNLCNSNNTNCTPTCQLFKDELQKTKMPTTVNITIVGNRPKKGKKGMTDYCAINLNIVGNVNAKIDGNVYEHINGDKFITQEGNLYHRIVGDIEIEHTGDLYETHHGNRKLTVNGEEEQTFNKNKNVNVTLNSTDNILKTHQLIVGENDMRQVSGNITDTASVINLN